MSLSHQIGAELRGLSCEISGSCALSRTSLIVAGTLAAALQLTADDDCAPEPQRP